MVTPPDGVSAFGDEIAAVLRSILTDRIVGAYFDGSIAHGGYVEGESDIDVFAVCGERVDEATRQAGGCPVGAATLANALAHRCCR